MLKKIQKMDIFFLLVVFLGGSIFVYTLFKVPIMDETFYPTIALRLINGDSLINDEWHLTQFSTIFQYMPVLFWVKITGSTQGIILFLRVVFFAMHTVGAFGLYLFFRKKGIIAVIVAVVFYWPFYITTINHYSIYLYCLLMLTFMIYSIYIKERKCLYVVCGVCFGCCCVCNPMACFFYFIYIALSCYIKLKLYRKDKKQASEDTAKREVNYGKIYDLFFSKNAIVLFSSGLLIVAGISILFYFLTGGTFSSFSVNIKMMLSVSEYSYGFLERIKNIANSYNELCFGCWYVIPLLFFVLFVDKKRNNFFRKIIYVFSAFCIFIFLIIRICCVDVGIFKEATILATFLPFVFFSHICYLVTENRDRPLFLCMWVPGLVGSLLYLFSSRALFMPFGYMLLACVVPGICFVFDFLKEIRYNTNLPIKKTIRIDVIEKCIVALICFCFVCQIALQGHISFSVNFKEYKKSYFIYSDSVFVSEGPLTGLFVEPEIFEDYQKTLDDLDYIKAHSLQDESVLIYSKDSWLYLYVDRPFATYSTWQEIVSEDALFEYYNMNPDKLPQYIYVKKSNGMKLRELAIEKVFVVEKTVLSNGVLFTVKKLK